MQSKTIEILLAPEVHVKFGARKIAIKECSSLELLNFVELVTAKAGSVVVADGKGKIKLDVSKLAQAVQVTRELLEVLVASCTDLHPEEALKLPPRVLTQIIGAALELNITKEFLDAGKAVGAHIEAVMGEAPKSTPSAGSTKR